MKEKSRFKIEPSLESFGEKYVKTVNENATLQGAIFMGGNEARIWWMIPETKTTEEKWACALVPYSDNLS